MITKYLLLTSFVFAVGALFTQDCEARCCAGYYSYKRGIKKYVCTDDCSK